MRMTTTSRRLMATVLVTMGLLAGTASPASAANVWTDASFNDKWPTVCVWAVNNAEAITGGIRFRAITQSYGGVGCDTQRPLNPGFIDAQVGVEVLNWTTGARYSCGYIDSATNGSVTWQVDTGNTDMTNAQMRSLCGIPSTHVASAGAQSYHAAVIWTGWEQTGVLVGSTHAAVI